MGINDVEERTTLYALPCYSRLGTPAQLSLCCRAHDQRESVPFGEKETNSSIFSTQSVLLRHAFRTSLQLCEEPCFLFIPCTTVRTIHRYSSTVEYGRKKVLLRNGKVLLLHHQSLRVETNTHTRLWIEDRMMANKLFKATTTPPV